MPLIVPLIVPLIACRIARPPTTGSHSMRLYTLGRFELRDHVPPASGAGAVAVQPKRLVLLAYLALASPHGVHRRDALLALYEGDFLAGVFAPGVSPELEEWLARERHTLRARAAGAAARIAGARQRAGDIAGAVTAARRACELAPDDESAARRLIALLADSGDRVLALRTFDEWSIERLGQLYEGRGQVLSRARALRWS